MILRGVISNTTRTIILFRICCGVFLTYRGVSVPSRYIVGIYRLLVMSGLLAYTNSRMARKRRPSTIWRGSAAASCGGGVLAIVRRLGGLRRREIFSCDASGVANQMTAVCVALATSNQYSAV